MNATGGSTRSVVIAGGGPVGLCLAALLGSGPGAGQFRVRLLEPRPEPSWDPNTVDLRVYALSRASQRILQHLGVWESIEAARASPYRRMRVWQGETDARLGSMTFDSADVGEPDLGHIVEDRLLRACLAELLASLGHVELDFGAQVTAVRSADKTLEITTAAGETLDATVLIAADGSASAVRHLLDLPLTDVSYAQDAVVTHVSTEKPHAETAWQRFLPDGPLAFLPLLDGRSSVVWSTRTEHAQALRQASDADFLSELQVASGGVLGQIKATADRAGFPLRAAHARQYCCQRVALAGDAAHTVHPLAGQGTNLGLLDAAVLSDVLEEALSAGEDPGDLRVLRRYERRRKGDNLKKLLAFDALNRLFALSGPLLPPLRAAGMSAIDAAPFAKTFLIRQALGLSGELPSAARARVA